MSQEDSLHQFGAYRKAYELFGLAVAARVFLCEEIIAILSATIRTLRPKP